MRYAFFGLVLAGCLLTFNLMLIVADRLLQRRRWQRWRWAVIFVFGAYVGAGLAILPLVVTNRPKWLAIVSIGLLIGSLAVRTILGGIRLRGEPDSN